MGRAWVRDFRRLSSTCWKLGCKTPLDKMYENNIAKINIMKKQRFKINLNKHTNGPMQIWTKPLGEIPTNNIVFPENISERQSLHVRSPTLNRESHLDLWSLWARFLYKGHRLQTYPGQITQGQITQGWWHGHNLACDWGTIPSRNVRSL